MICGIPIRNLALETRIPFTNLFSGTTCHVASKTSFSNKNQVWNCIKVKYDVFAEVISSLFAVQGGFLKLSKGRYPYTCV